MNLQIAEEIGLNVWESIELANKHPRVYLHKPTWSRRYCIPIDSWFIIPDSLNDHILSMARHVNDFMPNYLLCRAKKMLNGVKNPKLSLRGAYKGNVDDARESPATKFIKLAENDKFEISTYDPIVKEYCYTLSSLAVVVYALSAAP